MTHILSIVIDGSQFHIVDNHHAVLATCDSMQTAKLVGKCIARGIFAVTDFWTKEQACHSKSTLITKLKQIVISTR